MITKGRHFVALFCVLAVEFTQPRTHIFEIPVDERAHGRAILVEPTLDKSIGRLWSFHFETKKCTSRGRVTCRQTSFLLLCLKNKFLVSLPRLLESFSSPLKDTHPPQPHPYYKDKLLSGKFSADTIKDLSSNWLRG